MKEWKQTVHRVWVNEGQTEYKSINNEPNLIRKTNKEHIVAHILMEQGILKKKKDN